MSRIGGRGEAGKLFVTVEADTQKAKRDLDEVRTKLEQTGEAAEKSGDQTAGGLTRAGDAIEKQTEGVRKLTGAVTGIVGVFSAWVGAGALVVTTLSNIAKSLEDAADKSTVFKDEAEGVAAILASTTAGFQELGVSVDESTIERRTAEFRELRDELQQVNSQLADPSGLAGPGFADAVERLELRRETLQQQLKEVREFIEAARERVEVARENADQEGRAAEAIERQGAGVDELRKRREQLIDDLSDRETRLAREAAREIASFEEQLRQSQDEDERRLLLELIELRGQKFREQLKELEGEQIESAKRVGNAQREENDKTHRDRVRQIEEENRLVLAGLNEQADFIRAQNESDSGIVLQLQRLNDGLQEIKGIIPGGNIG